MKIDLNCDMGEGCVNDTVLMSYVSSANIACGTHAGSAELMHRTIDLAIKNNVAVGAHPGYPDREKFGRREMQMSPKEIFGIVTDQIGALREVTQRVGSRLDHVKPHGALYNQAARDAELAAAIAEAVRAFDSDLVLFGLSGSVSLTEGKKVGLKTAAEVFADRTYQNDGFLTSRTGPNALVTREKVAVTQVLDMVKYGRVRSTEAIMIPIAAETICIHGDGKHAVEFASAIRRALDDNGINIQAIKT